MRIPDFKRLIIEKDCNGTNAHGFRISYASGMHPSPYWYKYYYWVFCRHSPVDGRAFLSDEYRLCVYDAMQLIDELNASGDGYWLYNRRLPRNEPSSPLDFNHPMWLNVEMAPAYTEDSDPVYVAKSGIHYK